MPFTGIVEEVGSVVSLSLSDSVKMWDGSVAPGHILVVRGPTVLGGAYVGCSIAVNGVCLTVTEFSVEAGTFTTGLAAET